jgi:hypothetical protein
MVQPRLFFLFAIFVLAYAIILFLQLEHGLASLDAHAIVKVTRELVDNHRIEVSRPPGHPTTEFYLFGGIAWLLRNGFGVEFSEKIYLALQAFGGIAALCLFYELLCRLETPPWKALLASISLALSAQYFSNSVDGEEFVFAVLFLLLSLRLLIVRTSGIGGSPMILSEPPKLRVFLSILAFALATGCRPEAIFAGFIFPIFCLFHPSLGWRYAVISIPLQAAVAIVAVWLPILVTGLHPPYTAGMNLRESILGGTYRLVFQCFTVPVFLLFCWILFQSVREWSQRVENQFPRNFVFVISCLAPLIFCFALFFHASKPAHVIFVVPFVLLLAVERSSALLASLALLTVLGCFVSVDIFKERQLVPPYLIPGCYFQATRQKPYYRLPYLERVLRHCKGPDTVVIADLWRWDLEYQMAQGKFSAREEWLSASNDGNVPVFIVASAALRAVSSDEPEASRWKASPAWNASPVRPGDRPMPEGNCILLPRDGALQPTLIETLAAKGHTFQMDATLYRTLFARYNVTGPPPAEGRIGAVVVELFSTASH